MHLRKTEPILEPVSLPPQDATITPAPADDFPTAGEMPAWLNEPESQPSFVSRFARPVLWGGAILVAVGVLAGGGLWLQQENETKKELEAIARSSRDADLGGPPPVASLEERKPSTVPPMVTLPPEAGKNVETVVPDRKPTSLPPLVTLPPEQVEGAKTDPAAAPVPPQLTQGAPATGVAVAGVVVAAAADAAPVAPAPKPVVKKPVVKKPLVAKAPAKVAKVPQRTLAAAKWPPPPSRKLALAQNVVPKPVAKKVPRPVKATPAVAAKAQAKPKQVAGVMLPPPRVRPAVQERVVTLPPPRARAITLPPPRDYPRDPVPVPRSCGKGELARDCAN